LLGKGVLGMAGFMLFAVVGLLFGTAIYYLAHALGSDDAFAVEITAWWLATDLIALSGLRGWTPRAEFWLIQVYPVGAIWLLTLLVVAAFMLVILASMTVRVRDPVGGDFVRFHVLDGMAKRGYAGFWLRRNLARALASAVASLNLLIFLG
jgi:hypothetical protein